MIINLNRLRLKHKSTRYLLETNIYIYRETRTHVAYYKCMRLSFVLLEVNKKFNLFNMENEN